jgi:hypothetical protein
MVGRAPATPDEAAAGEDMSKASYATRNLMPTDSQRAASLREAKEMAQSFLSPTAPLALTTERVAYATNEAQLVKTIKVHLAKAEKYQSKAEEHFVTAGQYLMTLKGNSPDQATFLQIVKEQIGLGKSRAYELMQIADGTKTDDQIRENANQRKIQHRETLSVPERTNADEHQPLTLRVATRHSTTPLYTKALVLPEPTDPAEQATGDSETLVQEINTYHRELVGFLHDFTQRFTAWHQASPPIDKDGKAAIMQALYLCADGFAQLAQEFDGR